MRLKKELRSERVAHLDLTAFSRVLPTSSVFEAVSIMRQEGTHVCLILDGQKLEGIFTERDVLRKVVPNPETWEKPISELMTPSPITIGMDAAASDALWLMSEKGIRNLPAVDENGGVVGNLTNQSIIDYLAARYPIDILNLPPDPNNYPDTVEGG
jgi:CBS domain-containing protein